MYSGLSQAWSHPRFCEQLSVEDHARRCVFDPKLLVTLQPSLEWSHRSSSEDKRMTLCLVMNRFLPFSSPSTLVLMVLARLCWNGPVPQPLCGDSEHPPISNGLRFECCATTAHHFFVYGVPGVSECMSLAGSPQARSPIARLAKPSFQGSLMLT